MRPDADVVMAYRLAAGSKENNTYLATYRQPPDGYAQLYPPAGTPQISLLSDEGWLFMLGARYTSFNAPVLQAPSARTSPGLEIGYPSQLFGHAIKI